MKYWEMQPRNFQKQIYNRFYGKESLGEPLVEKYRKQTGTQVVCHDKECGYQETEGATTQ